MSSPPPQLYFPQKVDKFKFGLFTIMVDALINEDHANLKAKVVDDSTFTWRYKKLTAIIDQAAVNVLSRGKPKHKFEATISSPRICKLVSCIRHVGGAISTSRGSFRLFSYGLQRAYETHQHEYDSMEPCSAASLTEYLVAVRRGLHHNLYAARKAEIIERACHYDRGQMMGLLAGGLSKRLLDGSSAFVPLPTALSVPGQPGSVKTDPVAMVKITRQYFVDLYKQTPSPDKPKPWLTTQFVLEVKKRVAQEPFEWPVAAVRATSGSCGSITQLAEGNPKLY
ncbi:hypothetical protein C0993_001898 [Termitomyces sp. T159_Od127]|nr:hypothetical protein C0993_001898 [Termitomyces sp. T159_Od127]